jgi:hypothetical protein
MHSSAYFVHSLANLYASDNNSVALLANRGVAAGNRRRPDHRLASRAKRIDDELARCEVVSERAGRNIARVALLFLRRAETIAEFAHGQTIG